MLREARKESGLLFIIVHVIVKDWWILEIRSAISAHQENMEIHISCLEVAASMILNRAGMASARNVVEKLLIRRIGIQISLYSLNYA